MQSWCAINKISLCLDWRQGQHPFGTPCKCSHNRHHHDTQVNLFFSWRWRDFSYTFIPPCRHCVTRAVIRCVSSSWILFVIRSPQTLLKWCQSLWKVSEIFQMGNEYALSLLCSTHDVPSGSPTMTLQTLWISCPLTSRPGPPYVAELLASNDLIAVPVTVYAHFVSLRLSHSEEGLRNACLFLWLRSCWLVAWPFVNLDSAPFHRGITWRFEVTFWTDASHLRLLCVYEQHYAWNVLSTQASISLII